MTSGGKTAKAVHDFKDVQAEKYTFEVNLRKHSKSREQVATWREMLGNGCTVEFMEDFIAQTLGGVTAQVRQAAMAAFFIGLGLIGMLVTLFLKLRIAREGKMLAGKRAMGIPLGAVCRQELYPVLFTGILGTAAGLFLAGLLGDRIISLLFGLLGLGIKQITFAAMPLRMYVLLPMALLAVLGLITVASCRQIRTMNITTYFNE